LERMPEEMFQVIEFRTPSVVLGMDAVVRIGKEAKRLGGHLVLSVKDIEKIYERAFTDWGQNR